MWFMESYPRTTSIDEMRSRAMPVTACFFAYWNGKRHGRRMPARADIDPAEMAPWLDGIQLIDVLDNDHLVYRLVGEGQVRSRGLNPKGRTVEECFVGVSKEDVLESFRTAIRDRCMVYDWAPYPCGEGYLQGQETIFLPLSTNGDDVDKIMTFTIDRQFRAPQRR